MARVRSVARFFALLLVLGTAWAPAGAVAAEATLDQVLGRVQARYGSAPTLTAQFTQQDSLAVGGSALQKGTVVFKAPGRMRWDYTEPQQRLFLYDGKDMWMWTPSLNQVVHFSSIDPKAAGRVMDILHGLQDARRDYDISLESRDPAVWSLVLVPRSDAQGYTRITLAFDRASLDLRRAELVDAIGNTSTTTFSQVRLGAAVEDSRFRFTPPAGAEVIESP